MRAPIGHAGVVPHLPVGVRSACRRFAVALTDGSLDPDLLTDLGDYRPALLQDSSILEMVIAVFTNLLEVDDDGAPLNEVAATHRAAQWVRQYFDPTYVVDPPLEPWETELV